MKLRKKRGKVKGFEVKKGKIEKGTPDYILKDRIKSKFRDAYEMDNDALLKTGKVVIKKRYGAKYDPSKEEGMLKFNKENRKTDKELDEFKKSERRGVIQRRRERLKQDKKDGTGVYAKKTTKKSKIKGGSSTPLKMLKPKTDREFDIERRKKKLKKERESQRPVKRYMR